MIAVHIIAPAPFGGAERLLSVGLPALRRHRLDVRAVLIRDLRAPAAAEAFAARLLEAEVPVSVVDTRGGFDASLVRRLAAHLPAGALLHAHGYKATIAAAALPGPRVATHHGDTQAGTAVRLYEWAQRAAYRRFDAVAAVSRFSARALIAGGLPPTRVHTIENCLVGRPAPAPPIRTFSGRLLFLGRLSKEKGVRDAVAALVHYPAGRLTVAGDGPERAAAEALAARLNVTDRVRFLGRVDAPEALFGEHDVLVLPSLREGMPMTLIEAAAAGLPVVATAVGGVPEVLGAEYPWLTPPAHPQALAAALTDLDRRRHEARNIADEAARRAERRFAPARWAVETLGLYQSLTAGETPWTGSFSETTGAPTPPQPSTSSARSRPKIE